MINGKDIDGCTVLHNACRFGFCNYIDLFVAHQADLSIKDNQTQSPLMFACKYGKYEVVKYLLSLENASKSINEKDNRGQTCMHLAAQNRHEWVVQLLIKRGALFYNCYDGNTAMHAAASSGSAGCINTMLFMEPEILDQSNKNGNTALHLAAKNGHSQVINILLNYGAHFDYNNMGLTFVDLAIENKHVGALETIVSHKRWMEAMNLRSLPYKTPFIGMIQISSELAKMLMDKCITRRPVIGGNATDTSVRVFLPSTLLA